MKIWRRGVEFRSCGIVPRGRSGQTSAPLLLVQGEWVARRCKLQCACVGSLAANRWEKMWLETNWSLFLAGTRARSLKSEATDGDCTKLLPRKGGATCRMSPRPRGLTSGVVFHPVIHSLQTEKTLFEKVSFLQAFQASFAKRPPSEVIRPTGVSACK